MIDNDDEAIVTTRPFDFVVVVARIHYSSWSRKKIVTMIMLKEWKSCSSSSRET